MKECSFHEPMYIFLCVLAVCDLLLSTATVPKTLSVLWSLSTQISFSGCLVQMFSIYFVFVAESAVLLAMAFDRYIAICPVIHGRPDVLHCGESWCGGFNQEFLHHVPCHLPPQAAALLRALRHAPHLL